MKKFLDMFFSIVSAILPIMVLQLFSLPMIGYQSGGEEYGFIITIISLITIIGVPIGNVLCNIRLLENENYKSNRLIGDFNILLTLGIFIGLFLTTGIFTSFIGDIRLFDFILIINIIVITIIKDYMIVSYRIEINYRKIFLSNLILSTGYVVGTFFYFQYSHWSIIYLVGLIPSCLYVLVTTQLYKEPFTKTVAFKSTLKKTLTLYIASFMKTILNNADKIIIFPLLGATNVAIYYSASVIGKIIQMLISPINSVVLSYLVKETTINKKKLAKELFILICVSGVMYGVIILMSPYFLSFFYPKWAQQSLEIIEWTTLSALILMFASYIQPYNMRFNSLSWQIKMTVIQGVSYLLLISLLIDSFGLLGYAIAITISNFIMLIIQLLLLLFSPKK